MLIFQGVSIHDFLDISGGKKGNVEERTGNFVGYSEKSSSTSESSDSFLIWSGQFIATFPAGWLPQMVVKVRESFPKNGLKPG